MTHYPVAGLLSALFAVLIWGAQLPIAKSVMLHLDGFTITVLRYGIAMVFFVAFLWWKEGRQAFRWEDQTRPILIGGCIGMGGSAMLVFLGLSMTKPELAVIIISLQPGMTALAQWLIFKHRPSVFTLGCLGLAFAGVVVAITRGGATLSAITGASSNASPVLSSVVSSGSSSVGSTLASSVASTGAIFSTGQPSLDQLIGECLVLLGAMAWVTYVLASSRLARWSALRIATVNCIPAMAVITGGWLVAMAFGLLRWPNADVWFGWLSVKVFYISLFGVFLAMMFWNNGSKLIGPLNAMLILNLMPIITFAFRALEGASFEGSELIGAGMVVSALVANNLYQRWKTLHLKSSTA